MAVGGTARATRSLATPMARNSHPARSVEPSVRANQPFIVRPTPASARAAAVKPYELIVRPPATWRCDSVTCATLAVKGNATARVTGVTVTLGVTGNPTAEVTGRSLGRTSAVASG